MKTIAILLSILLSAELAAQAQTVNPKQTAESVKKYLEENVAYSQGHVGIINPQLYIVTASDKNELLLGDNHLRWTGLPKTERQVVLFFQGSVYSPDKLPPNFALTGAILISFEGSKIKFFDLAGNQIGFYRRLEQ
jgi:hypothetical protein